MGTIGNQTTPGVQFAITNDSYNGDGSTTAFTLSQSVSATTDIEVIVDNVQQSPHDGSYSVSGTALTFSGAPSAGTNNIYVIYHGSKHHTTAQVIPDDGSVHSSKIASLAVTHAKLHTDMDLSTKNVNPITMSTGTNKMQMAIQSAVANRFALRSTHTADYDNNPFIVYQPTAAGAQNDALVITAEGYITKNKQPAFLVKYQPSVSSGNYIVGGSVDHNVGNHFNSANGTFTVPLSGRYHFVAGVLTSSTANARLEMFIHVNGSSLLAGNESCGNNQHGSAVISAPINLTANDAVRFWLSSGNMHNAHANNYFGGYLIG